MASLEVELAAFEETLRGQGIPFPEHSPSADADRAMAGFEPERWRATSVDELRAWFGWVGPGTGNPELPLAEFFLERRKLRWTDSVRVSATLGVLATGIGLPSDEVDDAIEQARRHYRQDVAEGRVHPWVEIANDRTRSILYNLDRSTVYSRVKFGGRFVELGPFPELVALWNRIATTLLVFDADSKLWESRSIYIENDPIWRAAGRVNIHGD